MSRARVDSTGRIETIVAALVLLVVIGLAVRFQGTEESVPSPEPPAVEAPAHTPTSPEFEIQ